VATATGVLAVMAVEELLLKIRELDEGQAELKEEILKLVPEQQQGAQHHASRRPP